MKNNIIIHLIAVPIYWVLTYFNPLILALFTSSVATVTLAFYIFDHFRSKRHKEEQLAHILYRLDKILK